jgi:hypothetical protein
VAQNAWRTGMLVHSQAGAAWQHLEGRVPAAAAAQCVGAGAPRDSVRRSDQLSACKGYIASAPELAAVIDGTIICASHWRQKLRWAHA